MTSLEERRSGEFLARLTAAPALAIASNGEVFGPASIRITRRRRGDDWTFHATNRSASTVHLSSIVLFDLADHALPGNTAIFGEGFQMLSMSAGTLAEPIDAGDYTDRGHYRMPEPAGTWTVYGLLTIDLDISGTVLLAFTSCRRFIGRVSFNSASLQVSVDTEGMALLPGETWALEEMILAVGSDQGLLLKRLANRICKNHPPLPIKRPPTGWCSWYCYWENVTRADIIANATRFAEILPELRFIQIDDGYSPTEGDWLDPNPEFGDIRSLLEEIRGCGFEPAIWVAPFIADSESRVLREHPEWFVKGEDGRPLDSSEVSFGGWRRPPWYVIDGTSDAARRHLENVFRVMRKEWGVRYFKLDANFWGAIHGGLRSDPNLTRIEAYRRGMEAVIRGAGPDAIILGCNAPLWPSFGLVNAMRIGDDISREWHRLRSTAQQNARRNWMGGRLWINDPDAVTLAGAEEPEGSHYHATVIHAAGGSVMSGDKAEALTAAQISVLHKLAGPTGIGAVFRDAGHSIGSTRTGGVEYHYLFNHDDAPADRSVRLSKRCRLTDFWTGEQLGEFTGELTIEQMPARSARLLIARPVRESGDSELGDCLP